MDVGHGRGTAWGWLEINIDDPRMREDLKPPRVHYNSLGISCNPFRKILLIDNLLMRITLDFFNPERTKSIEFS